MIEELYNKIDKFCNGNETDWSKYPTYEHALEEFIKGIVAEETKELEKENAEAKNLIEELASSLSVVGECGEEECELINKAQKFINKPIF